MRLSEPEREWVLAELNASLEPPMSPEQEAALLELLEHRRAEYLSGRAETVSFEEVMAKAWAKLAAKEP